MTDDNDTTDDSKDDSKVSEFLPPMMILPGLIKGPYELVGRSEDEDDGDFDDGGRVY